LKAFEDFEERGTAGQILTLLVAEANVEHLLGLQQSPTGLAGTELWFILCTGIRLPEYAVFLSEAFR